MAAIIESCDEKPNQSTCYSSDGCLASDGCAHSHSSTNALLRSLTFAALLLTAAVSVLTWQISSSSCGDGGCLVVLSQFISVPLGRQPAMPFQGLGVGHVTVSYGKIESESGRDSEADTVLGAGIASDYAEEELRMTHVDESAILSALQRGEEAARKEGDSREGREENPAVLVAEIRSKMEDNARLFGNLRESAISEEISSRPFAKINVGDVLKKISNGAVDGVDYLTSLMKDEVAEPTTVIRAKPGKGRRIYIREYSPAQKIFEGIKEGEPIAAGVKSGRKISIGGDGAVTLDLKAVEVEVSEEEEGRGGEEEEEKKALREQGAEVELVDGIDGVEREEGIGGVKEGEREEGTAEEKESTPEKMFEIRRIPGWTERAVVEYPDEERPAVRVVRKARRMMSVDEN